MRSATQSLAGAATQSLAGAATRSLAGTTRAASAMAKAATGAGASTGKAEENRMAEARNRTDHLAGLPHHHLAVAAEVEAEAGGDLALLTISSPRPLRRGIACESENRLHWSEVQPDRLSDLEKNSIFCWFDLKNAFEKHFRGTYKRPATASDLQACIQKKGETSRNYLTRWLACRNECENVDHTTAMYAFIVIILPMMTRAVISRYSNPHHQQKKNRDNGNSSSHKRKNPDDQKSGGSEMVAMAFQRGETCPACPPGSGYGESTHTNRCKWVNDLKNDPEAGYKRARKHRPRGKGGKGKNKDKEDDSSKAMDEDDNSPDPKAGSAGKSNPFDKKSVGAYHTFLGTPTVRATKSATRILNAIVPAVPQYVKWSEIPCTFDRKDHPAIVPKECYALVVSPRIDGYDFSKCLMDGGASLNIMYLDLERMNLTKEQLNTATLSFMAWFRSSYHVIFGRPTYHKFHAERATSTTSSRFRVLREELKGYEPRWIRRDADHQEADLRAKTSFKAAIETKKHDLIKGDSSKQAGKLRHYFQEHPVTVVSKAPLSTILNNADATGHWTEAPDASLEPEPETWVMHFDGSKQHQGSGAGVTLKSPTGEELYVLQIHFEATNNMAEYEALHGLRIAKEIGIKHIICLWNSDLVAQQVAGTWNARNSVMAAYRDEVDEIAKCFLGYEVKFLVGGAVVVTVTGSGFGVATRASSGMLDA
ncbi:hypothetical protein QYE76_069238 [Lolium multiflorum]|uniref:RNase H type-1 domain-containing protein n=1 Tax=Lolium multiflorum TaxID=4521 RepID=A0AAD8SHN0_LOLMU|nr:hypothetical protein QYE76_069238 [Lolium multiflorum]